jgi:hypothetical protein
MQIPDHVPVNGTSVGVGIGILLLFPQYQRVSSVRIYRVLFVSALRSRSALSRSLCRHIYCRALDLAWARLSCCLNDPARVSARSHPFLPFPLALALTIVPRGIPTSSMSRVRLLPSVTYPLLSIVARVDCQTKHAEMVLKFSLQACLDPQDVWVHNMTGGLVEPRPFFKCSQDAFGEMRGRLLVPRIPLPLVSVCYAFFSFPPKSVLGC